MSPGTSIESSLFTVVCAALDDRLRPVLERLARVESRITTLEPADEGLTYKQAARELGVSTKTVSRWVDAGRLAVGGGTPRSPRILRSEVRRILQGPPAIPATSAGAKGEGDEADWTSVARSFLSARPKSRKGV